jgi:hypothetical protein
MTREGGTLGGWDEVAASDSEGGTLVVDKIGSSSDRGSVGISSEGGSDGVRGVGSVSGEGIGGAGEAFVSTFG